VVYNGFDDYIIQAIDEDKLTNIVDIASEGTHLVALKSDGSVTSVGQNDSGQCNTTEENGFTNVEEIKCSIVTTIGLRNDGTVIAVGDNMYGQCNTTAENGFTNVEKIKVFRCYYSWIKK
jgi:alpha-tubulin suppressor-like RCC1 family protein